MRAKVTVEKLKELMRGLAKASHGAGNLYFTGGSSALLLGIREQTIDVDVKLDPEPAGVFEAIATLKDQLEINIELAAPDDFIPVRADWRENSRFIETIGKINFFHFDFLAQALAKLERGYDQDKSDVRGLIEHKLVSVEQLLEGFNQMKSKLIRYPGIDSSEYERRVYEFCKEFKK